MSYNDIMTTKKQCDRCGFVGTPSYPLTEASPDGRWAEVRRTTEGPTPYTTTVDICSSCADILADWVHDGYALNSPVQKLLELSWAEIENMSRGELIDALGLKVARP